MNSNLHPAETYAILFENYMEFINKNNVKKIYISYTILNQLVLDEYNFLVKFEEQFIERKKYTKNIHGLGQM